MSNFNTDDRVLYTGKTVAGGQSILQTGFMGTVTGSLLNDYITVKFDEILHDTWHIPPSFLENITKQILTVKKWKARKLVLKLNKDNIADWKQAFDQLIREKSGYKGNYSECMGDDDWLDWFVGNTPAEAADEEISNWD